MTEKLELYKCSICGNIVQVIINGNGQLVCCGQDMNLLIPHNDENNELAEKHVPRIEECEHGRYVTLKYHPMNPEHYIQFIEVYSKDKTQMHLKYFTPDEKAELNITSFEHEIEALELCNIHGLWRNNND